MSEYQYYEFAAIDGPISDEGLRYARGCSSRANVSRVRWQNTYSFGDFHGSVDTLLNEPFHMDPDALAVAAGLSQASTPNRIPIAAVLEKLPVSEMRALLARVAEGGGSVVMTELNRLTCPRAQIPVG